MITQLRKLNDRIQNRLDTKKVKKEIKQEKINKKFNFKKEVSTTSISGKNDEIDLDDMEKN